MSDCASPRVETVGEISDHAIDALIDWLIGRRLDDPDQAAAADSVHPRNEPAGQ